jgi:hypothetical protein
MTYTDLVYFIEIFMDFFSKKDLVKNYIIHVKILLND